MREVLEHPFFGIGKLAGEAPVFDRPTLGSSAATNTVDINAYTDEHLKHRNEIVAEAEAMAKTPEKKEMPAVVEKEKEDELPAKIEDSAHSLESIPETPEPPSEPSVPSKPELKVITSKPELKVKVPEPPALASPRRQSVPTLRHVPPPALARTPSAREPSPVATSSRRKSKFGFKLGKKK